MRTQAQHSKRIKREIAKIKEEGFDFNVIVSATSFLDDDEDKAYFSAAIVLDKYNHKANTSGVFYISKNDKLSQKHREEMIKKTQVEAAIFKLAEGRIQ